MLDMETLNPGKLSIVFFFFFSMAKFHLQNAIFFMLYCTFLLCTEWNNAMDLNRHVAVNGTLEGATAEGTVATHIQVMQIKSLSTFFLLSQVVFFQWCIDLSFGGLSSEPLCGGKKRENKILLHISSGAYLNHHLIFSSNLLTVRLN